MTSSLKLKCYHALRLECVRRIRRYSFVFQIIDENKFNYLWSIVCYILLRSYSCYVYFVGFVSGNLFIFSPVVYAKEEGNNGAESFGARVIVVFLCFVFIICIYDLVKWDSSIIYVMSHKQRNTNQNRLDHLFVLMCIKYLSNIIKTLLHYWILYIALG